MRIHTSAHYDVIVAAARLARVDLVESTIHASRSHNRAYNVKLEGESRRRPNGGSSGAGSGYAATWDQWGVFLAHIFAADPNSQCGSGRRPVYANGEHFADKTADRFGAPETIMTETGYADVFTSFGWPVDYHGDHTFRFEGRIGEQSCTKCSAVQRWEI